FGQRRGAILRTVDDPDFRNARLQKRCKNGAGRPAAAEDDGRPARRGPTRGAGFQVRNEPERVAVGAMKLAVGQYGNGVDGANGARLGIDLIEKREGGFLMRYRQVAAGEAEIGEA